MKISTLMKTLIAFAGFLFTVHADAASKPENGNVVISKVFYSASKGATSGNYAYGQYIELYNNSNDEVDITGLYIGLIESESAANAYSVSNVEADESLKATLNGKVVLKQLFQIPTDKTYTLASGQTVVICNSAIDHTSLAKTGHNLSDADFEVKTTNSKYTHNDNVPALNLVYSFNSSTDFMNLSFSGPAGIVLLKNHEKAVDLENKIYAYNKTKGNEYVIANLYYCVDAVDIIAHTANGIDEGTKRLSGSTNDAGYATTTATGTYNGETVYRKTAFAKGCTVLFDTNNSSTDFQSSATIQPRQYDTEAVGLTETTIVIPESGYQVFQPTKTFTGPKDLYFVYLTGNKKNADVKYNNIPGDSLLMDKSNWIAVGKPGTYTVQLSDAQPMLRITSNMLTWSDEDSKTLTGNQATRSIYKFNNEVGKMGFKRVPATNGAYNVADFTDGNRLYLTLTADMVKAFYAANGAASAEAFDFIVWHGITPEQVTTSINNVKTNTSDNLYYTLSGQRVSHPSKGLYIVNGKKIIIK